tara:strand:+ start:271 stop:1041 length:771 start_codon:yes stop_codon:yes gene_type:complete
MKGIFKKILWAIGVYLSSRKSFEKVTIESKMGGELLELALLGQEVNGKSNQSQLGQDIVALLVNKFKQKGFFVEFGGTNGYDRSNTYLLEKEFNWQGIIAEPMPRWHKDLYKNRNCMIDERCVWSLSDQVLEFLDVEDGELSTISSYANNDNHSNARKKSTVINVKTTSLLDLLKFYNAPKIIDYLSVDTEGSELEILSNFPFDEYKFNFVSIEHNYTANRRPLRDLMKKNGYKPILEGLSKWDDWFISTSVKTAK